MSMPNSPIAAAPTLPAVSSRCGAIASSVRASRSSLSSAGSMPITSSTAQVRARSPTRTNCTGEDNRLATSTSTTCPCVRSARSRIGHNASTVPATSSRRGNPAATGRAPRRLVTTEVTTVRRRGCSNRGRVDPETFDKPEQRGRRSDGHRLRYRFDRNRYVRSTGLARALIRVHTSGEGAVLIVHGHGPPLSRPRPRRLPVQQRG